MNVYEVLVPKANGSGAIGEVLSTPLIGSPLIGFTETYISIGSTKNESEAEAILKYVKTKFARTMLLPAQSSIDWSKPVSEIDKQLYKKYDLDDSEVAFIESMIRPME